MVVHGEQRFTYSRPLHAGDVVTAQSTISNIREVGSLTMVTTETEIQTVDGEHVCTVTARWWNGVRNADRDRQVSRT